MTLVHIYGNLDTHTSSSPEGCMTFTICSIVWVHPDYRHRSNMKYINDILFFAFQYMNVFLNIKNSFIHTFSCSPWNELWGTAICFIFECILVQEDISRKISHNKTWHQKKEVAHSDDQKHNVHLAFLSLSLFNKNHF